METRGTKEAAESVLRELPSVVGAFVREDAHGYPREVHLLIAPGPKPRHFALDVKSLLEERLGVPIDQRIISIAQLAPPPSSPSQVSGAAGEPAWIEQEPEAPRAAEPPVQRESATAGPGRLRFLGSETQVSGARATVRVRLSWEDMELEGSAVDLEAGNGRVRAAAFAVVSVLNEVIREHGRFELDSASLVRVMDRDYVLVSVVATSPVLGRRPVMLAGAHPVDDYIETAASLATLKSANRLVGWVATLPEPAGPMPARTRRP